MSGLHTDPRIVAAVLFAIAAVLLAVKPAQAQYAEPEGYGFRPYTYYYGSPYIYGSPRLATPPGIYWDPDTRYGQYGYSRPLVPDYRSYGWGGSGQVYGPGFDVWDRPMWDDSRLRRGHRIRSRPGGGRLRTG